MTRAATPMTDEELGEYDGVSLGRMKDEDYKRLSPEQLLMYNKEFPKQKYNKPYRAEDHPYPKMKYRIVTDENGDRRLEGATFEDARAEKKAGDEWKDNPQAFGIQTCPAAPEIRVQAFELNLPPAKPDAAAGA